jgi:hypothetical protein
MSIPMYSMVGSHVSLSGLSAMKTVRIPNEANGVLVQALTQNVRIKLSGNASGVSGFQIKKEAEIRLIPLGGTGSFTVQEETASATLEYQFVRVHDGLA